VALWGEVALPAANGAPAGDESSDKATLASSGALLRHFLQERWKGLTAIAWGDQLRQARLDEIIDIDTLGVDLLPQSTQTHASDDGLVTSHPAIATEYHAE
jgi:glycerol-3-phosphate dehydrogenase